jgi:hypothetical protein
MAAYLESKTKNIQKIAVRTKRYECLEISSDACTFSTNAEVELLPSH